jgi:hypothetical protein
MWSLLSLKLNHQAPVHSEYDADGHALHESREDHRTENDADDGVVRQAEAAAWPKSATSDLEW